MGGNLGFCVNGVEGLRVSSGKFKVSGEVVYDLEPKQGLLRRRNAALSVLERNPT